MQARAPEFLARTLLSQDGPAANWTPRGVCCLHSRRILELDTRGIRTRTARTLTFSKRSHDCVRAGRVCACRAMLTKVPLSLRNRAKRSPHARTRWRKHQSKLVPQSSWRGHCCRKRAPVLARSLLSQPWVCRKRGPVLARSLLSQPRHLLQRIRRRLARRSRASRWRL